jgi:hypothetical protein
MSILDIFFLLIYTTGAGISFVISYLYLVALKMSKVDGRDILRAIAFSWLVIGSLLIRRSVEEIARIEGITLCGTPVWDGISIILFLGLLIFGAYFLYATVKRNPPRGGVLKRR